LAFLEENSLVQVVGSGAYVIDSKGNIVGVRESIRRQTTRRSVIRRGYFLHPTVMGRRNWFLANPYDSSYTRAEDHELWSRTYEEHAFANLADRLMFYREDC